MTMDLIRKRLEDIKTVGIAAGVLGLILGWFVIGWWLWPVVWTDGEPEHLRADLKEDYLRLVIDSYMLRPDQEATMMRWEALQPDSDDVLTAVEANPGDQMAGLPGFKSIVQGEIEVPGPEEVGTEEEVVVDEESPSRTKFLLIMCLVTILLGGTLAAYFLFRSSRNKTDDYSSEGEDEVVSHSFPHADLSVQESIPPMSQFMTTYMLGDDLFDDSFSIDSPTGEFLGECGVGISESIGVGEPKKVTAFEVWLFDKNDIQTITNVLMSQHAFADDTLRTRLAAKGDPILMEIGAETKLETATLRLIVRVVDIAYGTGASPTDSHFDRVTLELAVWQN
jgi:hypothetical protein